MNRKSKKGITEQISAFKILRMKTIRCDERFIFLYLYKTTVMQPKPGTLNSEHRTLNCVPETRNAEPATCNMKHETLNSLNCGSGTLNSEYRTPNCGPGTLNSLNFKRETLNCRSLPLNPLKGTLRRSLTFNSFSCTSGTFSGSSTLNFKPELELRTAVPERNLKLYLKPETFNMEPVTLTLEPETCNWNLQPVTWN